MGTCGVFTASPGQGDGQCIPWTKSCLVMLPSGAGRQADECIQDNDECMMGKGDEKGLGQLRVGAALWGVIF